MSDDCLFCKIANHDIPANIVYENDELVAFHDVSPQAPCHLLIVPRRHISTLNDTEGAPLNSPRNKDTRKTDTAPCSTATVAPVNPSSIFICTCWRDGI